MSRYRSATWKPISGTSTRPVQKDLLCLHTMAGYLASTWTYFNRTDVGVYSHFGIGGIWGSDADRDLDGVAWQMADTDYRAAANLDGNWHIISVETADNATRPIAPWTPKQCDAIVRIMVDAHQQDGIPLVLVPDSKIGRRGIAYHRLGCDPYRVAGGELWSSAYGKDCPTDPRIKQLPGLVARAQAIVNGTTGGDDMSAEDVQAINEHTDAQVAELLRVLGANLGESAVNNPRAWLNAGIAARLTANERANLAPLLDDEAKLREVVGDIPPGLTVEDIKAALRVVLAEPAGA